MAGPSSAELLQSLAQQVESMSATVAAAVEASRKESGDLVKKNQALQAALLAKSSEGDAATAMPQVSVEPKSFMDHLASDTVKLVVFNRERYVHRSILSSIPFFEAKMEHWCDEPVTLPEEITEPAFSNLLTRLYVGTPLPTGNVALCVQIIHLAKYWLLDGIVGEMVAEVLRMAKEEDVPVLHELAKRFDIVELIVAMEKLQKGPLCSSNELEGLVSQALMTDRDEARKLCTALLKEHPEARHVLRERFAHHSFAVWSTKSRRSKTFYRVNLCPRFEWFWQEVKEASLLKMDLPFISKVLVSTLNQSTEYRMDQLWGDGRVSTTDTTLSTLATALHACDRFDCGNLLDPLGDVIDAAADGLHAVSLQPEDLRPLLTRMPKCLFQYTTVDEKMAKLIANLPLATAHMVLRMMVGRIADVGPETAAALEKIMAVGNMASRDTRSTGAKRSRSEIA